MAKINGLIYESKIRTGESYRLHPSNLFAGMPDEIIKIVEIRDELEKGKKDKIEEHWYQEENVDYWVKVEYDATEELYDEVMKWYPLEILLDHITLL